MTSWRTSSRWLAAVLAATFFAPIAPAAALAAVPMPVPATSSAPIDVYPLGDSITFGLTPDANTPGGYRSALDAALTQAQVAHRLIGSSTLNASPTLTA